MRSPLLCVPSIHSKFIATQLRPPQLSQLAQSPFENLVMADAAEKEASHADMDHRLGGVDALLVMARNAHSIRSQFPRLRHEAEIVLV